MNVTRDVITDLLPLYEAGEASADTRALVDAFLDQNPEFARWVRERPERVLSESDVPPLSQEHEMKTLHATKRLTRWHNALFAVALFLSLSTLTVGQTDERGVRWLWADFPIGLAVVATLAALTWIGYALLGRRLRATSPTASRT